MENDYWTKDMNFYKVYCDLIDSKIQYRKWLNYTWYAESCFQI